MKDAYGCSIDPFSESETPQQARASQMSSSYCPSSCSKPGERCSSFLHLVCCTQQYDDEGHDGSYPSKVDLQFSKFLVLSKQSLTVHRGRAVKGLETKALFILRTWDRDMAAKQYKPKARDLGSSFKKVLHKPSSK
ncbi:PREDICTED: uncharacterized protein LOC106301542 isoform X2 [Brassica oleracea var. oleracea]|uniref:uncharacterized protein LOC106301542 isoform X2 n=1 Tax=Brassica oleracea var. oleracea TaxID=109376 RepID=UPI0006A6F770|nr:PREDICTED: uncharacterized protein LOC106301542 isoform X2 [Brassica oleracea var. oleracea]